MNTVPQSGTPGPGESAADKVLTVLSAFATRPTWDLGALASHLGLPKSTTHRLLGALRRRGYVRQLADSSRYALGYQAARLANALTPHSVLKAIAHDHLHDLASITGETAFLLVSDGSHAVCVDLVEPASPIRFSISIGTASPLHRGSSGRVLLAFETPATAARAVSALPGAERGEMEALLADVRRRGWAYTVGELTAGTGAISVPVLTPDGALAGCLAVGGPEERLTPQVAESLYPRLRERAAAISAAL
jgi:DNA-binding IclR family transcriptional regulator